MMCYPINTLINGGRMPEVNIGPNLRKWLTTVEARYAPRVASPSGLIADSACRPAFQRAKKRIEEEEAKAKAEKAKA